MANAEKAAQKKLNQMTKLERAKAHRKNQARKIQKEARREAVVK